MCHETADFGIAINVFEDIATRFFHAPTAQVLVLRAVHYLGTVT